MDTQTTQPTTSPNSRTKLLEAAVRIVRQKGYGATSVDDLCQAAGVTKGAFFHHFKTKEELGVAAADHWSRTTGELFAGAPYHHHADPLDRILGYLDYRAELIRGSVAEFTCLVGTMAQETYLTHPAIRDACYASISGHAVQLEADFAEALRDRRIGGLVTARSLALHTQAVLQGAFILAKAKDDPAVALDSIAHLKCYLDLLLLDQTSAKEPENG